MMKSSILNYRSFKFNFGDVIRHNAISARFLIIFNLFLICISLFTGQHAYLLMAFVLLGLNLILLKNAYIAGVFWIIGFSTVTGFYRRLTLYGGGQLPSSDYVRLVLEVSILAYFIFAVGYRLQKNQGKVSKRYIKWLDVVVTCYLLISTFYAFNLFYVDPFITIYGWRWVAIPIFMYYIGRIIFYTSGTVDRLNKFVIILLLLQAGYGAYQSLIGYPVFEQPWIEQHAIIQDNIFVENSFFIAGKFRTPALTEGHAVGGFLIPMLFLWILFLPRRTLTPKRWQYLRILALIFGLLFLLFSNERAAIGMVGVGIATVFFLKARRKLGIVVFLVCIPIVLIGVVFMSQIDPSIIPRNESNVVYIRLLELLNPLKSGTLRGRFLVYWPIYWEFFKNNPLGYGIGSFHAMSVTRTSDWGLSPHNMYLQIVLETGVIGLLSFFLVLVVFFKYIYNFNKKYFDTAQKGLIFGIASSCVAFLAIGVANQPIESFPLAIFFWFSMGCLVSCFDKNDNLLDN